uniref:Putative nudix hydrolase fgf-2 n=1 Tax=Triatoma dimidiata TaxID=72491 RepID=A0A0V0GEE6_TRIDM
MSTLFSGEEDIHCGVTVSSVNEPCSDMNEFTEKLKASLSNWEQNRRRAIWFKVNISQVQWIPVLAEHGFRIHNGVGDVITMVRWLPKEEVSRVPIYAHTMVGAGALVLTSDDSKLLTVRERYRQLPYWKLPGGYVEPHEDIAEAAIREVLEETNIRTEFEGLVTFRHSLRAVFDCSDLYFIVSLKPLNFDIIKQNEEVEEVVWMDVSKFLNHPEVHDMNRKIVRKCLEDRKTGTKITKEVMSHPITGRPQSIYSVTSFPVRDI